MLLIKSVSSHRFWPAQNSLDCSFTRKGFLSLFSESLYKLAEVNDTLRIVFQPEEVKISCCKVSRSLYVIFITNIKTIFRNFKLYKGLHFNFKIASHYFT